MEAASQGEADHTSASAHQVVAAFQGGEAVGLAFQAWEVAVGHASFEEVGQASQAAEHTEGVEAQGKAHQASTQEGTAQVAEVGPCGASGGAHREEEIPASADLAGESPEHRGNS